MLNNAGEKILRHFNATRVTLVEVDRQKGIARSLNTWQTPGAPPAPATFDIDAYYGEELMRELSAGRTVAISHVGADSRTAAHAAAFRAIQVQSSIHSPHPIDSRFFFKLAIHKSEPHDWTRDEIDLCRELTATIYVRLQRAQAAQNLRESEERLRLATEAADMFVWEVDLVTKRMTWAENAAKVIGCSPDELPAGSDDSWFFVHPEDRESGNEEFRRALKNGEQHFTIEFRGIGDNPTYWRAQSFVVFDAAGRPARLIGTTQNISARKQSEILLQDSEERLRLILDSVIDHAIVTVDGKGVVTGWNPGAGAIFGYEPDEIIGQSSTVLFTPEDRAANVPEQELVSARTTGRAEDERWHVRKDGSRFYASGVMTPLKGSSGGFVKVARDLTEKQKAEEELRQAREELELRVAERTKELDKSNKALKQEVLERTRSEHERVALLRRIVTTQEDERGRIARDLHDQLGQRLTALRLKIASLKDACALDKELHARVRHIEQIGARLDSEVSFLAWELRPRALDDLGLVSAVESFIGEWSHHFDIPAEFHSRGVAGKRLEPEIETNLYRITQEALNNISKHAQASTANVILESRNNEIVLVVEDNGVGFDVSQVENGTRSSGRLGLLGMNERAAISGGKIEIESAKGAGTTVFVRVPAKFATNGDHNGS